VTGCFLAEAGLFVTKLLTKRLGFEPEVSDRNESRVFEFKPLILRSILMTGDGCLLLKLLTGYIFLIDEVELE